MKTSLSLLVSLAGLLCELYLATAVYVPLREYSGATFFDDWDFYGSFDNLTWGNVTYQDRTDALQKKLAYVNDAGRAIIKVDNETTIADGPLIYRDSIRVTSRDAYPLGSVIIIDATHIPFGCSVWPSFWTLGAGVEWPNGGEIDIIEAINMMTHNQVAVHTTPGCMVAPAPAQAGGAATIADQQSGQLLNNDCSVAQGCITAETKPNSYGAGFAQAGGGVYAVQIDVNGIFVWFFSRPFVPDNIRSATTTSSIDTTLWGLPTAAYPAAGCDISQYFAPQKMVLLISLCGVWAGVTGNYEDTCQTPTNSCVRDNIIGPGSPTYDDAYWEINWIRTYFAEGQTPPSSAGPDPLLHVSANSSASGTATQSGTATGTQTEQATQSAQGSSSGAVRGWTGVWEVLAGTVLLLAGAWVGL